MLEHRTAAASRGNNVEWRQRCGFGSLTQENKKNVMKRMRVRLITALAWTVAATARPSMAVPPAETNAFNFQEASRNVPKPRELYPLVKQDMVPMDLMILSDRQDRKEK